MPAAPRGEERPRRRTACGRTWGEAGITGLIVLMEEPELFLPPQAQRYLYRLLRTIAGQGNQILYSTHSPRS